MGLVLLRGKEREREGEREILTVCLLTISLLLIRVVFVLAPILVTALVSRRYSMLRGLVATQNTLY